MKFKREHLLPGAIAAALALVGFFGQPQAQVVNPGVQQVAPTPANNDCVKWVMSGGNVVGITTNGGSCGAAAPVQSVFTRTGAVVAQNGDYSIGQITNGLSNVLTTAHMFIGVANVATDVAMSQDCTLASTGVITCTKTNNVAFAASATTDTTNAGNIGSGTLNTARLPSPFTNGSVRGNTSVFATYSGVAPGTGNIAKYDASGNIVDGGAAGTGTVTSVSCDGVTINNSGACPTHNFYANCTITASVAGNNLTVAIKDNAGSDPTATSPCAVYFRNSTLTNGTYVQRLVTAATSFTANSGSSLGCAATMHIWVTFIDNGSTAVLGVGCFSTSGTSAAQLFPLQQNGIVSSTACNACINATTAGTQYSTAAQTSKPYVVAGYLEWSSGIVTPGTWAAAPTLIQNYYPGLPLPGAILQQQTVGVTASTTANNATVDVTGATVTMTPGSVASLFRAKGNGAMAIPNNTPVCEILIRNGANAILAGNSSTNNSVTVGQENGLGVFWTDGPKTTSAVTYKLSVKSSAATNCSWPTLRSSTNAGQFEVEEIQG